MQRWHASRSSTPIFLASWCQRRFGSRLQAQIEILPIALYGRFDLRALVFVGTHLIVSGAIYLMLAKIARAFA